VREGDERDQNLVIYRIVGASNVSGILEELPRIWGRELKKESWNRRNCGLLGGVKWPPGAVLFERGGFKWKGEYQRLDSLP